MSPAESEFAAKQHGLVFSYLRKNNLDERDFYDVVVFGFLSAVQRYLSNPNLQRYRFSTIAWRSMQSSVSKELRANGVDKRNAQTVSLEGPISAQDELAIETWLSRQNDVFLDFETGLLIKELERRVSRKQMDLLQMRIDGYSIRLIAKAHGMAERKVSATLAELYDVVEDICYG